MFKLQGKKKIEFIILCVLLVLVIGFIWGSSCFSREASSAVSGSVTGTLNAVIEAIFGKGQFSELLVRKFAHLTEFFVLSLLLCRIYSVIGAFNLSHRWQILLICLFVALIDESIQYFSARAPSLGDVGIDFLGSLACFIIYFIISVIYNKIKIRKSKKKIEEKRGE